LAVLAAPQAGKPRLIENFVWTFLKVDAYEISLNNPARLKTQPFL
jgi:hypothetical protein